MGRPAQSRLGPRLDARCRAAAALFEQPSLICVLGPRQAAKRHNTKMRRSALISAAFLAAVGGNENKSLLAAFKMACLRYEPGPVTYEKKTYARTDLMDMRDRLLGEAESALVRGISTLAPNERGTQKAAFETPESDTANVRGSFAEDPSRPASAASVSTRVPSRPDSAAGFVSVKSTPQRPLRPASSGPTRRRTTPDGSSPVG